jgi:hypothetical protein
MTLTIETIGGNCPVQAEGTIDGKPFYFRARGRGWSIGIGGNPIGHPRDMREADRPDWYVECFYTSWPNAGWMTEDEARRLIEWCAGEYARNVVSGGEVAS